MRRLFLALLLLVFLPSMSFAEDKFVYIGQENNGNLWYIDTTAINENEVSILSCYCLIEFSPQQRQQLVSAARNGTAQDRDTANRAVGIIAYQNIDRRKRVFRNVWIDFYDANGHKLYRVNYNSGTWRPVVATSPVDGILMLVANNSLPVRRRTQAIEPQRIATSRRAIPF